MKQGDALTKSGGIHGYYGAIYGIAICSQVNC